MSIIVVLTSTGFRPSAGRNVFLTSFSLFRRAMNRTRPEAAWGSLMLDEATG